MMSEPEGWRVVVHQSLVRSNLWLGCERKPALLAFGLFAAMLVFAFATFSVLLFVAIALIAMGAFFGLRKAAQFDPQLFETLPRHWNFRPFTPEQPSHHAAMPPRYTHQ